MRVGHGLYDRNSLPLTVSQPALFESAMAILPCLHTFGVTVTRRMIEPGIKLSTAQRPGSAAAPTAGLHFTPELFMRLADKGVTWVDVTLHIGIGTFRPIQVEHLEEHAMHAEWAEIAESAAMALETRRREGGRVVAVGTTTVRTLETAASSQKCLRPFSGETQLFIQPGHVFCGTDALITNFHLPRSSLVVLVSAFAGVELIRAAYAEAVHERYRFFSYGDAMLIL